MINKAEKILISTFGYDSFRPLQKEIIKNILEKKDTLVIMPTGGGKSLCFQIPALIFQGLTIVVSPLISLMRDQVEQLSQLDIPAVYLNSSLSFQEFQHNVDLIKDGKAKLLYVAPETLLRENILALLSSVSVECIAIDEAHCISQWGHDFRPEYRQLVEVRKRFPDAICTALTATATIRVREDIKKTLNFQSSNEFIGSFNRENLFIEIVHKEAPNTQTINLIKKFPNESGIIYCFSRKQVESLYNMLNEKGFSVKPYHAGLSSQERSQNQDLFIKDNIQIIVATIAFGMGIDKPNVRFVIHYDLPKNIESYYQEIGRAGRDGLKSHCLLLLSYSDIGKIRHFIEEKQGQEKQVANIQLSALLGYAETEECRRIPLLKYFGEEYSQKNCEMCDNCLRGEIELTDITIPAQKFLSCIKRTGEKFGANHIIDVLRASKSKKILRFQHNNLSTYGIGLEFSKKQWSHLSRQFISKDLLTQDLNYGSLVLTEKAWDVLRGNEKFFGIIENQSDDNSQTKHMDEIDYNHEFFEILRKKRKDLAEVANVPPYAIFPDKTLIELAYFFPQSRESFIKIHGVGEVKLDKFGDIFIEIIKAYCKEQNIEERPHITITGARNNNTGYNNKGPKPRHIVVGELYNSGKSIPEIMDEFSVKFRTVTKHLNKYFQDGNTIERAEEFLNYTEISENDREKVINTFKKIGYRLLTPVFEALNSEISFDDLDILRLYYLARFQTENNNQVENSNYSSKEVTDYKLYTIGHSNHSEEKFINLLKKHDISAVCDVRSNPYSSRNPQFNRENLIKSLKQDNIAYVFLGKELGPRTDDPDCYIDNIVQYKILAKTPLFQQGLERLRKGIKLFKVALLCAEKDPVFCHRTILVCRNIRKENIEILHILEDGEIENNYDTEKRLMELLKITPDDEFTNTEQMIEHAYNLQSEIIIKK